MSLLRAPAGFVIGGLIGFVLGISARFSKLAGILLDRSIQMIRALPLPALLHLVIAWFGVDEAGEIFLVSLGVSFLISWWRLALVPHPVTAEAGRRTTRRAPRSTAKSPAAIA